MEGGFGALAPFVAVGAAGAVDGLFHRLAGEDAEQHGDVELERNLADREADAAVDVLVVRGFAADDDAEADHGGVLAPFGKPLGDERDFPRAGDPGDVDLVVGHAGGAERFDRPLAEDAGDRLVPLGDDDRVAVVGVRGGGLDFVRHSSRGSTTRRRLDWAGDRCEDRTRIARI